MIQMLYCEKCGRKLEENDRFCTGCGAKVNRAAGQGVPPKQQQNVPPRQQNVPPRQQNVPPRQQNVPPQQQTGDYNSVQYVYVNRKTGRITHNPHVKTGSEGCVSIFAVALGAVAVVIAMVAGTVILTGYYSAGSSRKDGYEAWEEYSEPEVSSWETSSDINTGIVVSSDPVSSEEVSSQTEPEVPEELLAKNMQKRIKGSWRTDVPYKSMNLPGTFEFDGKGKCKCIIKALLFSKKFEGHYTIQDGGKCMIFLDGLQEYSDNDTMEGQLRFINDNKMEFTVENTVWKLNRVE